jgi:hypothetical protein
MRRGMKSQNAARSAVIKQDLAAWRCISCPDHASAASGRPRFSPLLQHIAVIRFPVGLVEIAKT